MASDDIHSLASVYALDALDPEDERRFEAHLADCGRCRADVASFRESAAALAFASAPAEPPSALRGRILEGARAERPNVVPLRPRRIWSPQPLALAAAAVAACVAVGIGIWSASLHGKLAGERRAARAQSAALAVVADPSARRVALKGRPGALAVTPSGEAALVVSGLAAAPRGKTYEIWVIENAPRPAGLMEGGSTNVVKLERPVRAGATVAVTLERDGGVEAPTGAPLLSAQA